MSKGRDVRGIERGSGRYTAGLAPAPRASRGVPFNHSRERPAFPEEQGIVL